jgi:hypothetical protein
MNQTTRLGYGPDQRLLIVHADDLAIAHAVNAAIIKGLGTGLINPASVMVPCPWFPEVAAFAREHPEADLGIHLTMTSERTACRWRPTAPRTEVPSLVDRQGYFHQTWTDATPISTREGRYRAPGTDRESIKFRSPPDPPRRPPVPLADERAMSIRGISASRARVQFTDIHRARLVRQICLPAPRVHFTRCSN